jgi:hypothetical protein
MVIKFMKNDEDFKYRKIFWKGEDKIFIKIKILKGFSKCKQILTGAESGREEREGEGEGEGWEVE